MIRARDLLHHVIVPTLSELAKFDAKLHRPVAENLLLGTAAQESDLGFNLVQIGGGPGRGPYQMEPATNASLWEHYLARPSKKALADIVLSMVPASAVIHLDDFKMVDPRQLVTNLEYATAMARLKYWPVADPLPKDAGDIHALGVYWDIHYNANARHGTPEEFVDSWNRYVVPHLS